MMDGCSNQIETGCKACKTGYTLVGKFCRLPNCIFSKDNACEVCSEGYRMKDGACIKPTFNCVDFVGTICRKCAPSFYLGKDSHCYPYEVGCVEYFEGSCKRCAKPFQFNGTGCSIDGCSKSNSSGCLECASGYKL